MPVDDVFTRLAGGRFFFPRTGFLGGGLVYGLWFIIMVQGIFFFSKAFSQKRACARARA